MRVKISVVQSLVALWAAGTVINSLIIAAVTSDIPSLPLSNVIGICILLSLVNALASVLIYLVIQQLELRKRRMPPKHNR